MSEQNAVVAVYASHVEAEAAVKELQHAGIDMRTLSIAGKDSHTDEHVVGYYNTGRPHEVLGQNRSVLGRLLRIAIRVSLLCDSGSRSSAGGGSSGCMDRRRLGRRRGSGRFGSHRRRNLRHGHPEG